MKKTAIFFACILLVTCFIAKTASADVDSGMVLLSETVTRINENTFYIERIYGEEIRLHSNVRTGSKTAQYVHNGSAIYTLSVTGQFTYDGISAKATSASGGINMHVADAFLNRSDAYTSGASAVARASVSYLGMALNKTVALTCDANGNLA